MFRPVEWIRNIDLRWWIAAFWLTWCTATVLMLLPANDLPQVNIWDKAEHSGTFFILMVLAWLGYRRQCALLTLALSLIAYGIAIECLQYLIPSRSFSLLDMVANTTGVLPVWWLATRIKLP